jgi:hypothetical protein
MQTHTCNTQKKSKKLGEMFFLYLLKAEQAIEGPEKVESAGRIQGGCHRQKCINVRD